MGINTIIKCGALQPVKFQLVSRSSNEMFFYRVSKLMLPTLIQRYNKNHFIFDPVQNEGLTEILQAVNWHISRSY